MCAIFSSNEMLLVLMWNNDMICLTKNWGMERGGNVVPQHLPCLINEVELILQFTKVVLHILAIPLKRHAAFRNLRDTFSCNEKLLVLMCKNGMLHLMKNWGMERGSEVDPQHLPCLINEVE